ncbi:hypothetical protein Q6348_08060 [Isoptericola sp. b441]|uniref:Uncharacterized protein n=1 Tax=Actinotalea lenta TaxID=3064654 RepID=A0ABT9D8C8_9CELL|nr:hypothetical protein [Isoptericola sp. b441]MDO8107149.1 hypothetical protein [Isoptericola sp. b441]
MNLAQLKASLARNKKPLAIAGAVGVAGLAWATSRRKSGGATSSGTSSAVSYPSGSAPSPSYYTPGSAGTYDSTGTDVYNALQPQLQDIRDQLNQLNNPDPSTIPTPVPADPGTSVPPGETMTPVSQGYYRRAGTTAVYEAFNNGTMKWLDRAAYLAAGKPKYTDVNATDPLWNRTVVGTDAPAKYRTPK